MFEKVKKIVLKKDLYQLYVHNKILITEYAKQNKPTLCFMNLQILQIGAPRKSRIINSITLPPSIMN